MPLLQDLLQALTPREKKDATHWLRCPLHNRREDVAALFDLLTAPTPPEAPAAFARIYPEAPFAAAKYRQLEHQLLSRLEDFLAHQSYRASPYLRREKLLEAYQDRGLDQHRRTRLRRSQPPADYGLPARYFDYYRERELDFLDVARARETDATPYPVDEKLETYLLALQLRQACATLARRKLSTVGETIPIPRLPATLLAAASPPYRHHPDVRLFYLAAKIQLSPPAEAVDNFRELRRDLATHGPAFPPQDRRNLLLLAINHGLRSANLGLPGALRDTLELYRLGLQQGSLYERGQLSPFAFNNIIALSIHLGEMEWARHFLDTNHQRVTDARRNEIVSLARARLAFAAEDHGAALLLLQRADFKDFIHLMTARVMQLKIYFREDNFNLLAAHLGSTIRMLSRRKSRSGYHLENYQNIFRLARRILRLPPGDAAARAQLVEKISTTDPCTERRWLLKTLEDYAS